MKSSAVPLLITLLVLPVFILFGGVLISFFLNVIHNVFPVQLNLECHRFKACSIWHSYWFYILQYSFGAFIWGILQGHMQNKFWRSGSRLGLYIIALIGIASPPMIYDDSGTQPPPDAYFLTGWAILAFGLVGLYLGSRHQQHLASQFED